MSNPTLRIIVPGVLEPLTVLPGQRVLLGRSEAPTLGPDTVSITLADRRVSRSHAEITFVEGQWWFRDHSTSGSFVAGNRVDALCLAGQIEVRLADPQDGPEVALQVASPQGDLASATGSPGTGASTVPALASSRLSIRFGRAPDNDVVITDLRVSRHHAHLERTDDGWQIEDLGSENGTYVEGRSVTRRIVAHNDRITIGSRSFTLAEIGLEPGTGAALPAPPEGLPTTGSRGEDGPALAIDRLVVATRDGVVLLSDLSFAVPPGSFVAVVGPTGAGKSTLLRTLTGAQPPQHGSIALLGRDLYECYDELWPEIGYVPQEDIVHGQLSARQALRFGAELRFSSDTRPDERATRIDAVLEALGLSTHADKPIDQLSGGQRKRVSVALEVLTSPSLLLLDEPTSGLDPGYEQTVMELLRSLASGGRTVLVVTHSVASLHLCNLTLFMATGGRVGYWGPPEGALAHFGRSDYPQVFRLLEMPNQLPASDVPAAPPRSEPMTGRIDEPNEGSGIHRERPVGWDWNQHSTLVRRQVTILFADRRNLLVLAIAAVIPGVLLALLAGDASLDPATGLPNTSARTLLTGIVVSAAVIGIANGIREIVKEQAIYGRERAIGLTRTSYISSKMLTLGAITSLQTVLLVAIATAGAGGPGSGYLLPGRLELAFDVAAGAFVAVLIGLFLSSLVSTSEKAMALVPAAFVLLWLFSGSISALSSKPVLQDLAYAAPSNWSMAATASTAGLGKLEGCRESAPPPGTSGNSRAAPAVPRCNARWSPTPLAWIADLLVLAVLGVVAFLATDWALARREPIVRDRSQYLVAIALRWLRARIRRRQAA